MPFVLSTTPLFIMVLVDASLYTLSSLWMPLIAHPVFLVDASHCTPCLPCGRLSLHILSSLWTPLIVHPVFLVDASHCTPCLPCGHLSLYTLSSLWTPLIAHPVFIINITDSLFSFGPFHHYGPLSLLLTPLFFTRHVFHCTPLFITHPVFISASDDAYRCGK